PNTPPQGILVLRGALGFDSNDSVGFDIANSVLPNGNVGVTYSQTVLGVGGTGPYSFAVTSGTLPDGISLAGNGVLTGTPITTGSFTFTITATDNNGCIGSGSYTVAVGCATVTLTPSTLPNGVAGTSYSQSIKASPNANG